MASVMISLNIMALFHLLISMATIASSFSTSAVKLRATSLVKFAVSSPLYVWDEPWITIPWYRETNTQTKKVLYDSDRPAVSSLYSSGYRETRFSFTSESETSENTGAIV
ncbi:hypothetical protein OGAPHI_005189 [Ogataea philodendri]|uniref:Secreted protein n=1 Tax=Ogataea philodendri TaxID=1378263 RepID=A0A9P8T3G6_9ASCO|nr:uncharacterized protein OGAPHI_005189 [Ogataea philodendri]KAH3663786.1 hypothetical protein OGAPHI_005189 [Ogataea philodendri]